MRHHHTRMLAAERVEIMEMPPEVLSRTTTPLLAAISLFIGIQQLALGNLGVNITSLVAGLGVGGVAGALAPQNILGDPLRFAVDHLRPAVLRRRQQEIRLQLHREFDRLGSGSPIRRSGSSSSAPRGPAAPRTGPS